MRRNEHDKKEKEQERTRETKREAQREKERESRMRGDRERQKENERQEKREKQRQRREDKDTSVPRAAEKASRTEADMSLVIGRTTKPSAYPATDGSTPRESPRLRLVQWRPIRLDNGEIVAFERRVNF